MIALIALAAASATPAVSTNAAIFKAAGAVKRGARWMICTEDLDASARIDRIADLNGDGRLEAIVSEDGTYCHGAAGTGFTLLTQQVGGKWKPILVIDGIPEFLKTKGVGGWPDISVGGPGFCFPVLRWNGRAYANHRRQYEGKPCR
jgi:hypothetical protein